MLPFLFLCSENRYLLFLTENYAALEVLKHFIHKPQHSLEPQCTSEGAAQSQTSEVHRPEIEQEKNPWEMEPYVLFGSSFPKDTEYTQVCMYIHICMTIYTRISFSQNVCGRGGMVVPKTMQ